MTEQFTLAETFLCTDGLLVVFDHLSVIDFDFITISDEGAEGTVPVELHCIICGIGDDRVTTWQWSPMNGAEIEPGQGCFNPETEELLDRLFLKDRDQDFTITVYLKPDYKCVKFDAHAA